MIQELEKRKIEIAKAFNNKPKDGINMIIEVCNKAQEEPSKHIAEFFKSQKNNLNLEVVGDYLGSESKEHIEWAGKKREAEKSKSPVPEEVFGMEESARKAFTSQIDFGNKGFVLSMRDFLQEFELPKEGQKIDRLLQSFSNTYLEQNSNKNAIPSPDAAYLLATAAMMAQTSLHSPKVKESKKMTLNQFQQMLRNTDDLKDFPSKKLEEIYNDIKSQPFEPSLSKKTPRYTLSSNLLHKDKIYKALKERSCEELIKLIPNWKDKNIEIKLGEKNKLNKEQTNFIIADAITGAEVNVKIHKPKNSPEKIDIQFLSYEDIKLPSVDKKNKRAREDLKLAAELVASFNVNNLNLSINATYEYEKNDMKKAHEKAIEGYGGRIINSEQEFVREFLKESVDLYIKHKNAQLSNTNPNANVDMKNFVKQDINALLSTLKRNTEISQNDKSYDKKIDVLVDSFRNNLDEFVDKMDRKISEDRISILAQKAEEGNKGIIVEKDQDGNLTSIYEDVDHLKEIRQGIEYKLLSELKANERMENISKKNERREITKDQIKSLVKQVEKQPEKADQIVEKDFSKNTIKIRNHAKHIIGQYVDHIKDKQQDESLVQAAHNSNFMKISNELKENPDIIKQKDTGWKKVADLFRKIGISRLADFFDKKNEKSKVTSLAKDISLDKDVVLSSDLNNKSNKQSYAEKVTKNKVLVNTQKSGYRRT
ncbi:Sec7 domain-containing protein [Rickettsiaceae bacterium]|nr:Sec7 domain-containing protein [Rickettsiaceae bacterium]